MAEPYAVPVVNKVVEPVPVPVVSKVVQPVAYPVSVGKVVSPVAVGIKGPAFDSFSQSLQQKLDDFKSSS